MADIQLNIRGRDQSGTTALLAVHRVTQRVETGFREIDRAADHASTEIRQGSRQASQALDDVADSADNAAEGLADTGDEGGALGDVMGNLGGRAGALGEKLSAMGPAGAAAAAVIGTAMAGVALAIKGVTAAVSASIERAQALTKQKAQLGLTPEEAKKFGKKAGQLYAQNFGDSLEEAGNAVRDTAKFLLPLNDIGFDAVTQKVSTLATLLEEDTARVAFAVKQMVRTGMVGSIDEAFDLLQKGVESGIDGMGDMLDSMTEYNSLMKQSGLSAKQLFGLFKQGLDAGAFGTDKIADAIKEFRLKVTGGGKAIDDAFKAIGVDAKKATADIAKGGDAGAAALDLVLDKLRALNEVNPAAAAAALQALFGGPGEDLGASLFALDVTTATDALGNLEGAANRASATMSGAAFSSIEAYRRQWEMLKADIGDKLEPTFNRIVGVLERVAKALTPMFNAGVKEISELWEQNRESIEKFFEIAEPALKIIGALLIGTIVYAIEMVMAYVVMMGEAWENFKVLFAAVSAFMLDRLGEFIHGAAAAFGWIPGLGPKLQQAASDFDVFKNRVNAALNGIQKQVNIEVNARSTGGVRLPSVEGRKITGGPRGYPHGGIATGRAMINDGTGPEIIDLGARGARIINAETTREMMRRGAAGDSAARPVQLVGVVGAGADSAFGQALKLLMRSGYFDLRDSSGGAVQPT